MMRLDRWGGVGGGEKKKLNVRTEKEPKFGHSAGWVECAIKNFAFEA